MLEYADLIGEAFLSQRAAERFVHPAIVADPHQGALRVFDRMNHSG